MAAGILLEKTLKALQLSILIITVASRLAASSPLNSVAEEKKRVTAVHITELIKTDGRLDEASWQTAVPATDFIIYNPYNGVPSSFRTEVRVLYDNDALYIGAMMYDDNPDSIFTELGERDADDINADNFT